MEKPKFMRKIALPLPMINGDEHTLQITNTIGIQIVESFDNAITEEIIKMAKEKGINDLLLLNKTTIVTALGKQIPKKPIVHGFREGREVNTISFTCPVCHKHIGRENYCNHCGQALDWSDTDER